ncbi:MAG: type II secretion system F family protein [Lentisphaeria bacterium]|nr:type II secretion system F family protein [Lentisphaeria bacterium]MBQ7394576.1 type II secretion system F family protein [Lentisphaeria bacterium]
MMANLLNHSLLPSLMIMASISLAAYAILDFISFVSVRYRERYLHEAAMELDDVLIQMPAGRMLDLSMAISAIAALLTFLLLKSFSELSWLASATVAIMAAILLFPLPRLGLRQLRKRRVAKFNEQLEDVLMEISSSLKAGFSIQQAIEEVGDEARPPISVEFRLLAQECRLGVPLTQALENMNRRLESEDFELVATAIITARQTGGELTGALERLAALIRERLRIARKLHAITAMGRMQAWMIGAMPFVLLIGINYVAPALLEGIFDSIIGYALLGGVFLLVTIGFLVIRKITTIDI